MSIVLGRLSGFRNRGYLRSANHQGKRFTMIGLKGERNLPLPGEQWIKATESMATLNDSLLGQMPDEYRIDKALGVGGMARVYRAFDTRLSYRAAQYWAYRQAYFHRYLWLSAQSASTVPQVASSTRAAHCATHTLPVWTLERVPGTARLACPHWHNTCRHRRELPHDRPA
jgi:hypothetical protein